MQNHGHAVWPPLTVLLYDPVHSGKKGGAAAAAKYAAMGDAGKEFLSKHVGS
jgi:hypothetical protein